METSEEFASFEATSYGMKCHFPVAEVSGITIAVLPCQERTERLGLLLHPAPKDDTSDPSRQLYYLSWSFRQLAGSGYRPMRLACLGRNTDGLRFRGRAIDAP